MNETYSAFIRGRLPKYQKPKVDFIDQLSASVIIDQARLGGNARSTVGTISDMYSALRLLFSRIGTPYVGTASYFSFNDPNGMCPTCFGIGKVLDIDIEQVIHSDKSLNEDMLDITISDNGAGMTEEMIEKVMSGSASQDNEDRFSTGIAVRNVIDRLQLYYKQKEFFTIESDGPDTGTIKIRNTISFFWRDYV